jgi:hypothetical protein
LRGPVVGALNRSMVKRTRFSAPLVGLLLLMPLGGCGGDDDDGDAENKAKPVAGTFVGKLRNTDAFVSVVAAAPAKGQDSRAITVFVCDAKRLCDWYSGTAAGNRFVTAAAKGGRQVKGKLSGKAATGTVALPSGEKVTYVAAPATATAGLYDLTVSSDGKLRGASANGVGLKGSSSLPRPGKGTLKLADGKRLKFDITRSSADDRIRLEAGHARLIVLPDYGLRGVGKSRRTSAFFIRSSSG